MNLREIRLFAAVVETGGFTAAAEREGTAQPAVSAAVRRLEMELGAPLLVRGVRPLALTDEGAAFIRHARAILHSLKASKDEIRAMAAGEAGRVRLAVPPMLGGYVLPSLLHAFMADNPGVELQVVQAGAEEVRDAVSRGDADLGLIAEGKGGDGLETLLLQRRRMVAWLKSGAAEPVGSVLGWEKLLEFPLILFPGAYFQRLRIEQAAAALGRLPRVIMETDIIPLIGEAVRSGFGAATLLDAVSPPDGVVAVPLPEDAVVPVSICRRAHVALGAAARRLHDHLALELSARSPSGPSG